MNLWEYLDRRGARRAKRGPGDRTDPRFYVGGLFIAGYYALVFFIARSNMPPENAPLVRDALLVLGPPVGAIVGALFRSDRRDEQATANTGEAFRALGGRPSDGEGA